MDTIPIEGIFTCHVGSSDDLDSVDNYEAVFVRIYYPSKLHTTNMFASSDLLKLLRLGIYQVASAESFAKEGCS